MRIVFRQVPVVFLCFAACLVFFAGEVSAAGYGEGSYGGGKYEVGDAPATDTLPAPEVCGNTLPGSSPWLYAAVAESNSEIRLYYTQASDPVDHYALEFGVKSGEYIYSSENIGDKNTLNYLVGSLRANTTYYFRVRAGNGCATGGWSNEVSASTGGLISGKKLKTTEIKLEEPVVLEEPGSCQEYKVRQGDSLWSIAQSELGDGNLYSKIIELNKEEYSSLSTSDNVAVGWELNLCLSETEGEAEGELVGYSVSVKVVDKSQKPIEGAKVTMHSEAREATTDENGIAKFENVEAGEHKVLVAYDGYEGEQSVYVAGDIEEINLSITVEKRSVFASTEVVAVIGGLCFVIAVLVVLLYRARKRSG